MSLMGIDLGTSGCKAVVFDLEGNVLGSGYEEYPLIQRRPGWAELDPEAVWRAVTKVIARAASSYRAKADPVVALSLSVSGD